MIEQSIVFIDNISLKRSITGKILDILLRTELDIVGMKMFVPDKHFIKAYSTIVKSKLSRAYVKNSYLDKRIMVVVLQGEDAINKVKYAVGRERKKMKKEFWHGTTIRGMYFGGSRRINLFRKIYENAVQVSGSRKEAMDLIKVVWKNQKNNGLSLRYLRNYELKEHEERTFIMLKPETVEYRLAGKIIDDLSRSGLYIVAAKIARPTLEQFQQHYSNLIPSKGMKIYNEVVDYMSGTEKGQRVKDVKVIHLVYQGNKGEVTRAVREILGSTNPEKASIGTIRRSYGKNIMANVVHASALPEDTEKELAIWDTPNDLIEPMIEYSQRMLNNY